MCGVHIGDIAGVADGTGGAKVSNNAKIDIPMLLGTPGNQGVFDATDGADSDSDSTVHSWESDVERPHP